MKILMVLTSHDQLGDTGKKTGFWLEEFAAPYYVFQDAGAIVTLVSPKGGMPPIDPASDTFLTQSVATLRFKIDSGAKNALEHTRPLSEVNASEFDAVFYPGGHGPMWDLAESATSIALIENFYAQGKPVAAVCHAPAVFRHTKADGQPLVAGKHVTGFSNSEERASKLEDVVPFLLESELKRLGGLYEKADDGQDFTRVDGNLITGQNPASSSTTAKLLLKMIDKA